MATSAVYWIGSDGNAYLKSDAGVTKYTSPTNASAAGFSGLANGVMGQDVQATQIADPNPPIQGSSTTSAGSGVTAQMVNDSIAALNDSISQDQSQLGSTDAALKNGMTGIEDDYNKNSSRYNQDQTLAQQNYDKQRQTTTQDKLDATDAIYQNGNTLANSVRRIIGMASGRNSSAYQLAAPEAIAKDMTVKTAGNNATFKKNYDAIDTANNDTNLQFQRNLQDLRDKTSGAKSSLSAGILQQEQNILADEANNQAKIAQLKGGSYLDGKTAAAGATSAAQARQAAIDQLFNTYRTPYSYQAVTPTAATTADYNKTPSTVSTPQSATAAGIDDSPYAAALKKIFNGDQTATAAPAGSGVAAGSGVTPV